MAEQAILAEEMQTPKKAAFVDKPYSQEERRKRDEEELAQLIKEQAGEIALHTLIEDARRNGRHYGADYYVRHPAVLRDLKPRRPHYAFIECPKPDDVPVERNTKTFKWNDKP